jgi:hypothetical protein
MDEVRRGREHHRAVVRLSLVLISVVVVVISAIAIALYGLDSPWMLVGAAVVIASAVKIWLAT